MKSLKRKTEETLVAWLSAKLTDAGYTLPVYSGKRFMQDVVAEEDEENIGDRDGMVKPCLVIECSSAASSDEVYDPALGEATVIITLIRDPREDLKEENDGILFEVFQTLFQDGVGEVISEDSTLPYYGTYIVHDFAPPAESTALSEQDDEDVLTVICHCQHYYEDGFPFEP